MIHDMVMREKAFHEIRDSASDDLLTTGEAAKVLNASRQHIVNLCERGDLPFTTVGVHRRVRRSDIEIIKARTARMTADQRRSLWQAYAIAGQIVRDPDAAIAKARENLKNMRAASRGVAKRWLDEWEKRLDGPLETLLQDLVSPTPVGRELRQNHPFAGLVDDDERRELIAAWRSLLGGEP